MIWSSQQKQDILPRNTNRNANAIISPALCACSVYIRSSVYSTSKYYREESLKNINKSVPSECQSSRQKNLIAYFPNKSSHAKFYRFIFLTGYLFFCGKNSPEHFQQPIYHQFIWNYVKKINFFPAAYFFPSGAKQAVLLETGGDFYSYFLKDTHMAFERVECDVCYWSRFFFLHLSRIWRKYGEIFFNVVMYLQ